MDAVTNQPKKTDVDWDPTALKGHEEKPGEEPDWEGTVLIVWLLSGVKTVTVCAGSAVWAGSEEKAGDEQHDSLHNYSMIPDYLK